MAKYSFILDLTEEEFKKQEFEALMAKDFAMYSVPPSQSFDPELAQIRERWDAFSMVGTAKWLAKQGKSYPADCLVWEKYFGS